MTREIRRLAIANRGEPAMRVLVAVDELNRAGDHPPITTVVLHTDPDAQAWYVRQADEAVSLGAASFVDPSDGCRKSRYLDEPAVMDALVRAGVDAVWVGWGFLAERASFAQRCEEAGIVFVGPNSATIRLLGDKVAAKRVAERAGVPVVPWSGEPVHDLGQATAHAVRLGYPLVLKAAAGGGVSASCPPRPISPRRCPPHGRRRGSPSATRRCSWNGWCRPRGTWRSR